MVRRYLETSGSDFWVATAVCLGLALPPLGRAGELAGHKLLVATFRTGDTEIFIIDPDTGYDVFLDHQMTLAPFVGRSFKNSFVYAGAGPSLSHVGASLNDVVGFAYIPRLGGLADISSRPQSIAQTQ